MANNLSIATYALAGRMLKLLSVDKILLPRYGNFSINSRNLPLEDGSCLFKIYEPFFIRVYVEAIALGYA